MAGFPSMIQGAVLIAKTNISYSNEAAFTNSKGQSDCSELRNLLQLIRFIPASVSFNYSTFLWRKFIYVVIRSKKNHPKTE